MDFTFLIFQLSVLIFSVMIHEISHGFVAEKLGDDTARLAGRLTLNPLKHLDFFGYLLLPFLLFVTNSPVVLGWAKPVPYNPYKLHKDYKYGPLKVALAGPASNLLLLLILGLTARFGSGFLSPNLLSIFAFIAYLNVYLAVFNLLPIPPLDGSKLLPILFPRFAASIERIGFMGIAFVFIFLFLFSSVISYIANRVFYLVAGQNVFAQMINFLASFQGS